MSNSEEQRHLLDLWELNIFPYCGTMIAEGKRVGDGSKATGGFCSLSCYAEYYRLEWLERAKRVAAIARKADN